MAKSRMWDFVITCLLSITMLDASFVEELKVDVEKGKYPVPKNITATNCSIAIPNRLVYFEELKLSPNPIVFGEVETLWVVLRILQDIGNTKKLAGSLEVYMMLNGEWTDFCPLLGGRICHLKDFCNTMKKVPMEYCPLVLIGQPCSCPLHTNRFVFNNFPVKLPPLSKGIEGTFNVTLTLKEDEVPIGCTSMIFCLNRCS